MKWMLLIVFCALLLTPPTATTATDEIIYNSQPEAVAVFFNNVAFARDTLTIAGAADVQIILPEQVIPDTLIVRADGERVSGYRINRAEGRLTLHLPADIATEAAQTITLDYVLSGLSWRPTYDMFLRADTTESVVLDFFVELQNNAFDLDEVAVRLVAGRVDLSQPLAVVPELSMNQMLVGDDPAAAPPAPAEIGTVTIQHVYDAGAVTAAVGDTVYISLLESVLPARRVLLWNAQVDQQATIIYKVRNDSDLPLAEGIVRTYENDLFIGSDSIEQTPTGGEGSVTVGGLQDVQVRRDESVTALDVPDNEDFDTLHEVTLVLTSFADETLTVEVVERRPAVARAFSYSDPPEEEPGNILRWFVTLEPGASATITYEFVATS